jgi:hypothetical protein
VQKREHDVPEDWPKGWPEFKDKKAVLDCITEWWKEQQRRDAMEQASEVQPRYSTLLSGLRPRITLVDFAAKLKSSEVTILMNGKAISREDADCLADLIDKVFSLIDYADLYSSDLPKPKKRVVDPYSGEQLPKRGPGRPEGTKKSDEQRRRERDMDMVPYAFQLYPSVVSLCKRHYPKETTDAIKKRAAEWTVMTMREDEPAHLPARLKITEHKVLTYRKRNRK